MKEIIITVKNSLFIIFLSLIDLLIKFIKYSIEFSNYVGEEKPKFDMTTFDIVIRVITAFAFAMVYDLFLKQKKEIKAFKEDIKILIEKNREDSHEMDMFFANLEKRKRSYLYDCFKTGKILPEPKSWITEEEKRLYSKQFKEREKEIEMLNKSLSEE